MPLRGCTRMRPHALFAVSLLFFGLAGPAAAVTDNHYRVLVLHSHRQSLPVNTDWYRGIVGGFASASDLRIDIEIEALDLLRHSGPDYVAHLLEVFRLKFAGEVPDLILPTYTPALELLLEHDLFPGVPIVFCAADSRAVTARELPAGVTGITSRPDIAGTAELAWRRSRRPPIYGLWDTLIGNGILGGRLIRIEQAGGAIFRFTLRAARS